MSPSMKAARACTSVAISGTADATVLFCTCVTSSIPCERRRLTSSTLRSPRVCVFSVSPRQFCATLCASSDIAVSSGTSVANTLMWRTAASICRRTAR